jgi:hypothetical protein
LGCSDRTPENNKCNDPSISGDTCAYLEDVVADGTVPSNGVCSVCPSLLFENVGGICVLKTCVARSVNNSAAYVCGSSDCFYNGTGCNTQCGPYSEPGEKGCVVNMYVCLYVILIQLNVLCSICTAPIAVCDGREVQNVPINKCGTDCAYDPINNICVSECPALYIRNATSGACQLAACSQLTPD